MIRHLKTIFAAILALTAFGAIVAAAHASDEFHCSVSPCRGTVLPDGTGKTTHQVLIIENTAATESVSLTCEKITGEGTLTGNVSQEFTVENITYPNCTVNGSSGLKITMNGCKYVFTGAGGREDKAEVHVECPTGKAIELEITSVGCIFSIGSRRLTGIGYHTLGTTPNREVTVTSNVALGSIGTNGKCGSLIAHPEMGTLTTANAIVRGETTAGVMADTWYE